jgi:Na+-driven multidrug efflux pump
MSDADVPDAGSASGFLHNFLYGNNKCGTTYDGKPQTMSVLAWIWLVYLVIQALCYAVGLISGTLRVDGQSKWSKIVSITISCVTILLCIYIFYMHAQNCNALVGFFVTFLVNLIGMAMAAAALGT